MINLKLSDEIVSGADLRDIIEEIKGYAQWFNHNQIKLKVANKKDFNEPELSHQAKDILGQFFNSKSISPSGLDSLIISLEKYLKEAVKIKITLAGIPPNKLKKQLINWFRVSLTETILVDFSYNRTLLGGMVVIFGSHIYDWSLRRQILDSKDKLIEVFN